MSVAKYILLLLMAAMAFGCANNAGGRVAQGAARGATHGLIQDKAKNNTRAGAAHGAVGSAFQIRDEEKAKKVVPK